jgi:chromosome partitioning protein
MTVIAVASQKGGVGKTTVSLNLACSLARRGWRVLLVDFDAQGAIGLSLGRTRKSLRGLAEWLRTESPLTDVVTQTRMDGLSLLPVGNVSIRDTHAFQTYLVNERIGERIARDAAAHWDIVVLDTPAGFGGATLAALDAADLVISALQAEPIAMRSAPQMLEMMAGLRQDGCKARFLGFVLTMVVPDDPESMSITEAAFGELPKGSVFRTLLYRDPAVLEASSAGLPLALLGTRAPAVSLAFDQFAAEVEARADLRLETDTDGKISLLV